MIIYILPPVFSLIAAFVNNRINNIVRNYLYVVITLLAIFVYCCVHVNGTDWPNYKEVYFVLDSDNLFKISSDYGFELGFCILMLFFKTLGVGFFPFLIIIKSFSLIMISAYFKQYAKKYGKGYSANVFFLLLLFYLGNCMYLYVETIVRFTLALSIVVCAYKYMIERKLYKFLFLILLASFFHKTALIMLPIYFVKKIKQNNLFLFFLFMALFLLLTPEILSGFLDIFQGYFSSLVYLSLKGYLEKAIIDGSNPSSIGNIILFVFFMICLFFRNRYIETNKYRDNLFACLLVYFFLSFLTLNAGSVGRISLYLRPLFITVFATMLSMNNFTKIVVAFFVIFYFFLGMINTIEKTESFLPYTNYLFSTTNDIV